jgi:hypothetical protein
MNANLNPVFADALAAFVKPGGPIDATPRKVAPKLPTFTCTFTDDLNDWGVTYTAEGRYEDTVDMGEHGLSLGSAPTITVTAIEIAGYPVPLKAFSRQFRDCVEEHCREWHDDQHERGLL